MTKNDFSNGGLFNQVGGSQAQYSEKSGASKVIGFLMVITILAAIGAGIWFLQ